MQVVGVSGIDGAMRFKQDQWPGWDVREYRMSQGHDSAAALVSGGRIVAAAAEERFNLEKHSGRFPECAIGYCLQEGGTSLDEVDEIAHAFDYAPYRPLFSFDPVTEQLYKNALSREAFLERVRERYPDFPPERVHFVPHHLAHAASAYWTSGWDDCLVVVMDGMGEVASTTAYHAHNGCFEKIREIGANDSIGILYSLVTLHLGFDFNADEYKIMGLAPYGDPERFRPFFDRAVELRSNGTIRIPLLHENRTREERERYLGTRRLLEEQLIPARRADQEVTTEHRDVAAALQACLNRAIHHMCTSFAGVTGARRLALAGGVALNCTANGKLMRSGAFDEIYVQPAAGDDGAALGAALYRAGLASPVRNERMPVPFLGPLHGNNEVEEALASFGDRIEIERFADGEETAADAARLIADGRVLAWYRGRMEFGPRALGHRSILADPGHPEMRDRINSMVKKREAFRPFAPAVSLAEVHRWFDVPPGTELPYMIATVEVREEHRRALPAITHVDGTARVQTVSPEGNPAFHQLLQAVGRTTGREMVLNTSFNVKGQPIVDTPRQAIDTFLGTGIECLFLENVRVMRREGVRS